MNKIIFFIALIGIAFAVQEGENCSEDFMCPSDCCCLSVDGLFTSANCAPLSPEGASCEPENGFFGHDVYDICPCELGLECMKDEYSNYVCMDPSAAK